MRCRRAIDGGGDRGGRGGLVRIRVRVRVRIRLTLTLGPSPSPNPNRGRQLQAEAPPARGGWLVGGIELAARDLEADGAPVAEGAHDEARGRGVAAALVQRLARGERSVERGEGVHGDGRPVLLRARVRVRVRVRLGLGSGLGLGLGLG